jgi:tRNA threonylcarbamoyladenosine biosynthesis protein TsaE
MGTKIMADVSVANEKGTKGFAGELTGILKTGDTVLFYGDLGSGKTFLIREIVRLLGMDDSASSPSFSIVNQYYGKDRIINHIDLYRIKGEKELENLGLEDYLQGPYLNLIEWPQIIEKNLEWPHYRLEIITDDKQPNRRRFILTYVDPGN